MTEIPTPVSPTVEAIYAWHESKRGEQYDSYGVPFSALSDECDRLIWYSHHWAFTQTPIDGKRARLFETGNCEEARIIAELEGIGVEITNQQEKVKLCAGHLRGKIEGEGTGFPDAPVAKHTFEIKTHKNTKFNEIVKHGLKAKNHKHYVQLMLGVHAKGNSRGMYIMTCKNSDDLYATRFHLDPLEIAQWLARAERIIYAERPLAKLYEDPEKKAAFKCKACPAKGVCHDGAWARINCRTCMFSEPLRTGADGSWFCEKHHCHLTMETQKRGCVEHRYIPDLVPGVQVDFDVTIGGPVINYALHDGREWKDDGAHVGEDGAMRK